MRYDWETFKLAYQRIFDKRMTQPLDDNDSKTLISLFYLLVVYGAISNYTEYNMLESTSTYDLIKTNTEIDSLGLRRAFKKKENFNTSYKTFKLSNYSNDKINLLISDLNKAKANDTITHQDIINYALAYKE